MGEAGTSLSHDQPLTSRHFAGFGLVSQHSGKVAERDTLAQRHATASFCRSCHFPGFFSRTPTPPATRLDRDGVRRVRCQFDRQYAQRALPRHSGAHNNGPHEAKVGRQVQWVKFNSFGGMEHSFVMPAHEAAKKWCRSFGNAFPGSDLGPAGAPFPSRPIATASSAFPMLLEHG